ncbi:hypothetical protein LCGC14_1090740 [marine sediment metagenome]|uniref:Uncharacterized protein n=1 Tax=marine sediment metagenome TaxID=412755 RepID=A0A0F9MGW7_9ZZZZ
MTKKYKNDGLMKLLTILGALIGLVSLFLGLAGLENYGFVNPLGALDRVITFIIGLVVVVLTFLAALKPNNPIPFHWLILFILGVLLVIFGAGIWAGVLVIIAALIGLIEDL